MRDSVVFSPLRAARRHHMTLLTVSLRGGLPMNKLPSQRHWGSMGVMMFIPVFLVSILPIATAAPAVAAEALTVRVEGLSTTAGHVKIAIFDKADAFPDDEKAIQREKVPVGDKLEAVWVINGLAPGQYGVAVFHDIDDDGVLDTNFVGMPKEPYGFSNNARGTFGPPAYEATTFAFDGQPMTISIQAK